MNYAELSRRAEKFNMDTRRERTDEYVVEQIKADGDAVNDAIGGEAIWDESFPVKMNPALKILLIEAIECFDTKSQDGADQQLGQYLREEVYAYIKKGMDE